jgi:hypothetical protein
MTTHHAIAVYASCTPCAHRWLPYADEYAPGRWMGIAHVSHAAEMIAIGWILTEYPDEPPDVVCAHYHAAYWQGD